VKGYIALTDLGWYEHLARRSQPTEANFWRPSARRLANLAPATPFLFKLRSPHNAIAGFGYFASFSVLPDWLAWETFGEANGAGALDELRLRLARIQKGASIEADPAGRIGCSLIAEATLFARDAWIPQPTDWKPRTQSGETYDLSIGEGRRVWEECQTRVEPTSPSGLSLASASSTRFGAPYLHRPRLGQGIFRVQVLDAYQRACAVTEEHSLPVVEAAHIKPYRVGGEHDVRNGLALRTDLHRLFDTGYVTVDEQMRFVVGRRLKEHFDNGRSYYALHGRALAVPADT
jgi:HNH endonuclease